MEPNKDNKIPDLYVYLGVPSNATDEQIKKAYKTLAKQYHPDKPNGSDQKFQELKAVYEILSDPQKKQTYDRFKKEGIHIPDMTSNFQRENPDIAINMFLGNSIGALYAFIAIAVSIIFNVPLTSVFFPSIGVFLAPYAITGDPKTLAFTVGGFTGMMAVPFCVIGITANISKRLLETPYNYFKGVEDGSANNNGSASGDSNGATGKIDPTMLVLDENDFEFITKQKAEYEKINEIEKNWTFLSSEEGNEKKVQIAMFSRSIDNIKELVTVIDKHFQEQHPSNDSDLILKKITETQSCYRDIEYILEMKIDQEYISSMEKERNATVLFKYHKTRLFESLDRLLQFITDRINSIGQSDSIVSTTSKTDPKLHIRLLSLIKNTEISLEEYVFNSFEYYQI